MLTPLLVFAQTGPAGIGNINNQSSVLYWIDANAGITTNPSSITNWSDLSSNNINNVITGNITLNNNFSNNLSAVTFNGSSRIETNLSINANSFPNLSIIALYRPRINNAGGVWGEDDIDWDRFILKNTSDPSYNSILTSGVGPIMIPSLYTTGVSTITSVIYEEDQLQGSRVYTNGTLAANFTTNHGPENSSLFTIGDIGQSSAIQNFPFDGEIAEVIVYGEALNFAQVLILNNSLAAKYNLPLDTFDIYTADDPISGNYDHEVAGIGQFDVNQNHTDAQGTGIVRILNPSGLDDREFLIWGHDNQIARAFETVDVPPTIQARFLRTWRANEVNMDQTSADVGAIDMRFDLTDLGLITTSDLRLIIDTDNDGTFADETPISGATNLGNNVYEFAGITEIANNLRFTLGTINASQTTLLPIESLTFEARLKHQKTVILNWETINEKDNDFFSLERSNNGISWEIINTTNSKGDGDYQYTFVDQTPCKPTAYYRLKQTDYDGYSSYTSIKAIVLPKDSESLAIYPNPTKQEITIQGQHILPESLKIYNELGQDLSNKIRIIDHNTNYTIIDLSNLNTGIYLLQSPYFTRKIQKQ